ncbi:MAG: hypothetical protein CM1200mP18_14060 [Gammaproteobacteria bacterium]|nr:MAG: hypothetical protein CM1200mP18_14060 [Gammaproteobacteria bacterium]
MDQTGSNELSRNYFGGWLTKVLQANQFVGTRYVHAFFLKDLNLQSLISVIGCVCLFGMTFSIYSPLLSLLLEQRGASNSLIGSLATTPAIGVMLSSFVVPYCLKMAGARKLLLVVFL